MPPGVLSKSKGPFRANEWLLFGHGHVICKPKRGPFSPALKAKYLIFPRAAAKVGMPTSVRGQKDVLNLVNVIHPDLRMEIGCSLAAFRPIFTSWST